MVSSHHKHLYICQALNTSKSATLNWEINIVMIAEITKPIIDQNLQCAIYQWWRFFLSPRTMVETLQQRKVPIWTFLRCPLFKTSFRLHESRFLHTFTLYNPILIKMCTVQDQSWCRCLQIPRPIGDILLQRKVLIWTFLRSLLFKTYFPSPWKHIFTYFHFL